MKRRTAAAALALCLLLGSTFGTMTASASLEGEKDGLQSQKEQIEEELAALDEQLAATKNDIAKEQQYQATLDQQIDLNREKMGILDQQLSELNASIEETQQTLAETEAAISEKETEIDGTIEKYKERMRASYMAGTLSPLELLFSADSFGELISNVEMIKAISRHDTALLESLRDQQSALQNEKTQAEAVKADLESQQDAAEQSRAEMEATNAQLQAAYAESQNATQDLQQEQANFEANKEERLREAEEIEAEIEELMRKIAEQNAQQNQSGGSGIVTEAGFLWPLPGFSNINSGYGWRFNNTDFHTGLDLGGSGVYGADIVAAKSGVVASPMTHWSYGNNVVINHGDGYVTLYAHCSEVLVSPGETVSQGQVIARVGATGNVTGPHLHFEVYYNGVRQNPAGLIQY